MGVIPARVARWLLALVAVLAIAAQLVPIDRTNPPSDPEGDLVRQLPTPPAVAAVLARSCRDCHSSQTRWPWYSRVAPVSWLVASDVAEGREHLNFSEWRSYPARHAAGKLSDICDEVTSGGMPDPKYTLVHRDATVSAQDVSAVCGWTKAGEALVEPRQPGQ